MPTGRVIVQLDPELSEAGVSKLERYLGLERIRRMPLAGRWYVYRLMRSGESSLDRAKHMLALAEVRHAEPDWWTPKRPL